MNQLAKNIRVLKKLDNTAPHSICLVVDGNNGQNILNTKKCQQMDKYTPQIIDFQECVKYRS